MGSTHAALWCPVLHVESPWRAFRDYFNGLLVHCAVTSISSMYPVPGCPTWIVVELQLLLVSRIEPRVRFSSCRFTRPAIPVACYALESGRLFSEMGMWCDL